MDNNVSRMDTYEPSVVYNSNEISLLKELVQQMEPIVYTFDPTQISNLENLISSQALLINDLTQ